MVGLGKYSLFLGFFLLLFIPFLVSFPSSRSTSYLISFSLPTISIGVLKEPFFVYDFLKSFTVIIHDLSLTVTTRDNFTQTTPSDLPIVPAPYEPYRELTSQSNPTPGDINPVDPTIQLTGPTSVNITRFSGGSSPVPSQSSGSPLPSRIYIDLTQSSTGLLYDYTSNLSHTQRLRIQSILDQYHPDVDPRFLHVLFDHMPVFQRFLRNPHFTDLARINDNFHLYCYLISYFDSMLRNPPRRLPLCPCFTSELRRLYNIPAAVQVDQVIQHQIYNPNDPDFMLKVTQEIHEMYGPSSHYCPVPITR